MSELPSMLESLKFALLLAVVVCPTAHADEDHHPDTVLTRIAFGSCARQDRPQPIWQRVHDEEPDLFVWAGDNVYNDTVDPEEMKRKWAALQSIEGYARLMEAVPILGTWDDHDYGRNDAGSEYPLRHESQQIFLDFLGVASDSPRRDRNGVYHCETFGDEGRRVQVILLDTRYHRSPLKRFRSAQSRGGGYRPDRDRQATMLGKDQWAWLKKRFEEPADLRLVVSSIQFVSAEHRYEKWANLPRERSRMLDLIDETGASGVVFLSGDRHHAELSRLNREGTYPLYDMTSSGINQSHPRRAGTPWRAPEPNSHRIDRVHRGHHFGLIEIDWDRPDPRVRLSIVSEDGARPIRHDLTLSELQAQSSRYPIAESFLDTSLPSDEEDPFFVVDGDTDEWTTPSTIVATPDHLFLRFRARQVRSVASDHATLRVAVDLDDNDETGTTLDQRSGIDWTLEFSPKNPTPGRPSWQPSLRAYLQDGTARTLSPGDLGLQLQPTFASDRFEVRIDRETEALPLLGDRVHVLVTSTDKSNGQVHVLHDREHEIEEIDTWHEAATIPKKAPGSIRIVSFNVLWASPQEKPAPFARVLSRLAPDVLLLQEWDRDRYSEEELSDWLSKHVDGTASWATMVTGTGDFGQGTAVATPHPMIVKAPPHVSVEDGRWNFPVRLAAGVIQTPEGNLLAASLHLKASGSLGSDEDRRRIAEARAVNHLLRGMSAASNPDVIVLGGDLNLVGTTDVVHWLTRHLDVDRSSLKMAQPRVLGDPSLVYTHGIGDYKSRLDYLAYSEASAEVTAAFVLDTTRLDTTVLEEAGLKVDDRLASDHLPLVLDLRSFGN